MKLLEEEEHHMTEEQKRKRRRFCMDDELQETEVDFDSIEQRDEIVEFVKSKVK